MKFLTFSFLEKYKDFGLLVLRVGVGLLFFFNHGLGKLMGGPDTWEKIGGAMAHVGIGFFPVFWGFLAAFAESVCALLLAAGFLTRIALLFLLITMGMASLHHFIGIGDGMDGAGHSMKMAFVFLGLFFVGAGRFSVDQKLK